MAKNKFYGIITRSKMRSLTYFALIFILTSCGVPKKDYEQILLENSSLKDKITKLEEEIQTLKETDQFYYQNGADLFSAGKYEQSIDWMNKLKIKFPQSALVSSADKLIKNSNLEIKAIYGREKQALDTLLRDVAKLELEEAISKLTAYTKENHPADLIQSASQRLEKYETEYEKIRRVRELERSEGVRIVEYSTGWGMANDYGSQLFVPQLKLVFRNITDFPISRSIEIKVRFIYTEKNKEFGDDSDYLVSRYSDLPLEAGYSKTVILYGSIGYRNDVAFSSVPNLKADVYINDHFYKTYAIQKQYRK